jgi:hypothetical protein
MNACRFARYCLGAALFLFAFSSDRTFAQDVGKLPAGLAEVVRLVSSGVENDVILSYIQNSPVPKPTANDLIELHHAKVPSPVIVALLSKKETLFTQPTPAPVASSAPAPAPAPAPQQVISSPPPQAVYVARQPVYVQPYPAVVYAEPYYYPRGYDWAAFGIGLGLGYFGHYGGHYGHYGHYGGHYGHGGIHVSHGHH